MQGKGYGLENRGWIYERGEWKPTPFDVYHGKDLNETLEALGFSRWPEYLYGVRDDYASTLEAHHACANKDFALVVVFTSDSICEAIFIPDFPSYWQFLREAKDVAALLESQAVRLHRDALEHE